MRPTAAIISTCSLLLLGMSTAAAQGASWQKADTSPHAEHTVQANGIKLHYLDWGGKGEPMVMLTGYGPSAHVFDKLAGRFVSNFRVVALTRRGRAPSEIPSSGYDLATLTADIKAFVDALQLQRIHLVGHSFGGAEMTHFATIYPDRVASLVYLDAAIDPSMGDAVMKESPIPAPQPPPGTPFAQVNQWWVSHSPSFSKVRAPALAIYAIQNRNPQIPKDASDEVRARAQEYWRTKWIPMVRNMADNFRREVPQGRVVVLEDASHYLFADREDDVVREMEKFYASIK